MMRAANPALVSVPDAMLIPQIPGVIFSQVTTLNSLVSIAMGGQPVTYEYLSLDSDINFFKDAEGAVEFKGTDAVTNTTLFYSTIPFSLIRSTLLGAERVSFTIGDLLDEIGFNGSITYPLALDAFLNQVSSGETYENLNKQGLSFYSAATGGTMTGSSSITSDTMTIWSNWPLEDVASMF
jgi:hypothetical protein